MQARFVRRVRDGAWLDVVFTSPGIITTDPIAVAADLSKAHGEEVELVETDGHDPREGTIIPLTDKPSVLPKRVDPLVEAIEAAETLDDLKKIMKQMRGVG